MNDKIDLDAIIKKAENEREEWLLDDSFMKLCMKEAIHQTLVLASEKAVAGCIHDHRDGGGMIAVVDKQSILDVDKLIV